MGIFLFNQLFFRAHPSHSPSLYPLIVIHTASTHPSQQPDPLVKPAETVFWNKEKNVTMLTNQAATGASSRPATLATAILAAVRSV